MRAVAAVAAGCVEASVRVVVVIMVAAMVAVKMVVETASVVTPEVAEERVKEDCWVEAAALVERTGALKATGCTAGSLVAMLADATVLAGAQAATCAGTHTVGKKRTPIPSTQRLAGWSVESQSHTTRCTLGKSPSSACTRHHSGRTRCTSSQR